MSACVLPAIISPLKRSQTGMIDILFNVSLAGKSSLSFASFGV
jgi:hypothetical protein